MRGQQLGRRKLLINRKVPDSRRYSAETAGGNLPRSAVKVVPICRMVFRPGRETLDPKL
jgi:hypothetical protein